MADFTLTDSTDFTLVNVEDVHSRTYKAGEAITQGQALAANQTETTNEVHPADANAGNLDLFIGFALNDAADGQTVAVAGPGAIVTGHTFDVAGTAAHRLGNLVYTSATAGEIADTPTAGAVPVGVIVAVDEGSTQQAIYVLPQNNLIVPAAYTPTNVTPDRAFDADTVAIAELADIVGTLIADFQAMGLLV